MKKIGSIILIVLALVALISVLVWLLGPSVNGDDAKVGPMLVVAAAYLALAVLVMVVMTAMNFGKSRGGNGKLSTFVFGGLAVLAVVAYFVFAKDAPVTGADGTVFDDSFTLKITDMMLFLAYITLIGTVVFVLWGEVRKALK